MRNVDWYFDYISPYPYLQMARFAELPGDVKIRPRPVLFAALLNHWGHKGPAEIPAKRKQTYYYTNWLAAKRGLPFTGPPRHPFNPLSVLRLTIAAGSDLETVKTVYTHIWGEGNDGQSAESISSLAKKLELGDYESKLSDAGVKAALKQNTDEALALGVYGVPTLSFGGELFWGDDATDLFVDFLTDPSMFSNPPYQQIGNVTAAADRLKPR